MKFLPFTLLLFFACTLLADDQKQLLVGHWRDEYNSSISDMVFSEDGHFSGTIVSKNNPAWTFSGDWWLNDGVLTYFYKESSIAEGRGIVDHDKIVEITRDYLVVQSYLSGKLWKKIRINESK